MYRTIFGFRSWLYLFQRLWQMLILNSPLRSWKISGLTTLAVFGAIFQGIDLLEIVHKFHPFELSDWLVSMLKVFKTGLNLLFELVGDFGIPQLLRIVMNSFRIDAALPDYWKDVTILLWIYCISHIKESFSSKVDHKIRTFFWRFSGAIFGTLGSVMVSVLFSDQLPQSIFGLLASLSMGIVIYRIIFSVQFAFDLKFDRESPNWLKELLGKLGGVLVLETGFLAIMGCGSLLLSLKIQPSIRTITIVELGLTVFFLGAFHYLSALPKDFNTMQKSDYLIRVREISEKGNVNIGVRIIFAFAVFAGILALRGLVKLFQ